MRESLIGTAASRAESLFQTYYQLLPNPNILFARYGNRAATLNTIKDDPHVAACIQSRKAGVMALEREVITKEGVSDAILNFVNNIIDGIGIKHVISEILNAPLYGFQPMEIYYTEEYFDDNVIFMPTALVAKPAEWFAYDSFNILRLKTINNPDGKLLPPMKFIIVQHEATYNNPYGEAILSRCLWPTIFKKGGMTFWVQFLEKFAMPHFIGKTSAARDTDDYDAFLNLLDELKQDGSAVIGDDEEIEVKEGAAPTQGLVYSDLINLCNAEISKAFLSQTLTTELSGNTGSYAASKTHASVLQTIIDADKLLVENAINQLISWAVEINFGKEQPVPTFTMYPKEDVDQGRADFTKTLSDTKQLAFTQEYFINNFGFKPEEFKIIEPAQPSAMEAPQSAPAGFSEHSDGRNDLTRSQIIIDTFGDRAIKEGITTFSKILPILTDFLDGQTDFTTASDTLSSLLPKMDTKELERKLTNLLFMSDVIGRLSVQAECQNG